MHVKDALVDAGFSGLNYLAMSRAVALSAELYTPDAAANLSL